jgi:thiosulfate/3-mercaptopyruvate sulfurtransferase
LPTSSPSPYLPLLSPGWLAPRLRTPDLVILDCSWYLPSDGRDAEAEYRAAHIPGALRLDIDLLSAHDTDLPHMLPTPGQFAGAMEHHGIRRTDLVVCYDGSGVNLSAARVWWMFRVFGHRDVAVLDGGFPMWASATRPVQRGVIHPVRSGYPIPSIDAALIRSRDDVAQIVAGNGPATIVDCRSAERWRGEVDEPRPGVRRGRIDGSRNIPYPEFTDSATGGMRSPDRLRALFAAAGVDITRPVVSLCGSGTSACVLALAVEVLRADDPASVGPPVAVYDGSWAEWGSTSRDGR